MAGNTRSAILSWLGGNKLDGCLRGVVGFRHLGSCGRCQPLEQAEVVNVLTLLTTMVGMTF
eukprot:3432703-Amphidinium_carterae.2